MSGFLFGAKLKQSQMFDEQGNRIPVTLLNATACYLIDVIKPEVRGYGAVKVAFGPEKKNAKSIKGQFKKAGIETPLRFIREVRLDHLPDTVTFVEKDGKDGIQIGEVQIFIGEEVKANLLFKAGDLVDVTGISKGKGFQGVMKRHGFAGGPKTHGQSDRARAPGSMGQTTTPGRVYKGKRMAGRMGGDTIKVQKLKVMIVDEKEITVKGLVPGHIKGYVEVISSRN